MTDGEARASSRLRPVAITLLVVSVLWGLYLLLGAGYLYSSMNEFDAHDEARHDYPVRILLFFVGALYSAAIASGALCMLRGSSYGWSVTASILALVPIFSPCFLVGIPIGVWALLVLRTPEVRASFGVSSTTDKAT